MIEKFISETDIQTNGDVAVANMSFRETADIIHTFMILSENLSPEFDWIQDKVEAMRKLYHERMRQPIGGIKASV